jgi:hypothetical protein
VSYRVPILEVEAVLQGVLEVEAILQGALEVEAVLLPAFMGYPGRSHRRYCRTTTSWGAAAQTTSPLLSRRTIVTETIVPLTVVTETIVPHYRIVPLD